MCIIISSIIISFYAWLIKTSLDIPTSLFGASEPVGATTNHQEKTSWVKSAISRDIAPAGDIRASARPYRANGRPGHRFEVQRDQERQPGTAPCSCEWHPRLPACPQTPGS